MNRIFKQSILLAIVISLVSMGLISCIKKEQKEKEKTLKVGMSYQGGFIAYIDETGEHGLIAAPYDQSEGIEWGKLENDSSYIVTGATGTLIGTGRSNTTKIVQAQGVGNYAAKLCDDLVLNGYSDWFLPSKDELKELYEKSNSIGGFNFSKKYWSSSEADGDDGTWSAWCRSYSQYTEDKNNTYRVRAVRNF